MTLSKILQYFSTAASIIVIVGFVVVLLHIVDMSAGDTWALNRGNHDSFQHLVIYFIITLISLSIQVFLFLVSIKIAFRTKKATSFLSVIIRYIYFGSHITVIISIVYLLVEQISTSSYHTITTELIVGMSLLPSALILISLAFTNLRSFSSTKSKIVVVYNIAIIAIVVQLIIAFCYIEISLLNKPEIITSDRNPWISYFYSSLQSRMFSIYEISESISFIPVWMVSIFLTKQYANKIGQVKYSIIISIPAIYFLLQYSPLLLEQIGTLSSFVMAEGSLFLYFYNFVLNTVNVGIGILFGISFFILSKSIAYYHLKYYLIICGTGIMVIFSSGVSSILILAPFPAWAIVSLSFILPASFFLLIGLDSTTYYIASDALIRRYLYTHRNQFELFQALGYAKASDIVKQKIRQQLNNLEYKTMFKPISEVEDPKEYIEKVITEMKQSTNTKTRSSGAD